MSAIRAAYIVSVERESDERARAVLKRRGGMDTREAKH
jgi:hypothetical protein